MVGPAPIGARALRDAFEVAEQWLTVNRDGVNAINVFPVPDGDTGTNMLATWRAALRDAPAAPEHVGELFAAFSRGALLGARGNSGVILSQMIRGMAESLDGHASVESAALVAALGSASRTAYAAISRPVEGTMLTVMRDAAAAAEDIDLDGGDAAPALRAAVDAAYQSVRRTPELLPVLREAAVVDAGGMGVAVLLQGLTSSLTGDALPDRPVVASNERVDLAGVEHEGYGYCTEFIVEGAAIDRAALEAELAGAGGDSILVVGASDAVHVHVHMDDPGPALSAGARLGALHNVKVENMQAQHDRWAEERAEAEDPAPADLPPLGLVAVAPGPGIAAAFRELGARQVLVTGDDGKASAGEIVEAARGAGRDHVIVLPNDGDVLLAAQQAASAGDGFITVVPTRHVPGGLAAAVAYLPDGDHATVLEAMRDASDAVRCVEVSRAVRDVTIDGVAVRTGDAIVFVDGRLVARADDPETALMEGITRAGAEDASLVTLCLGRGAGADAGPRLAERIAAAYPRVEVETLAGHQPHYPYIAGVE